MQNYTPLKPSEDPALLEALNHHEYVSRVEPPNDEYGLTVIAAKADDVDVKVVEREISDCFRRHHYDIDLIGSLEEAGFAGTLGFCVSAVVAALVLVALLTFALSGLVALFMLMQGSH